ncbi:hypothetical protein Mal52_44530 [Symmachiella dynata]|uniref:Malonyl-CoA:ACP transacylase (MAT) domain-containing protein n=1 Tax=Symmachiella dynata TaxID=2527995 RepID=A0A517ZU02_9PLAN|nr:ACP S-malonyltransferase [Symmachiella dynata]QDU45956.1 hypothetical protein Mal52_44530 [Symmachiella dynata]
MDDPFEGGIQSAALAFRGYNVTNMGRSRELLMHPAYGAIVREELKRSSEICAAAIGRPVDLVSDVETNRETSLTTFPDDTALIVGMELAQLRLLKEFYGTDVQNVQLTMGYSVGELASLVVGGVYELDQLLSVPLSLCDDCASLAHDVTMGVVFTRGIALDFAKLKHLCMVISCEGKGLIGPSAQLAPNAALVLGQGKTITRFNQLKKEFFEGRVVVHKNPHHWPPLHTPLVWEKSVANRAGMKVYHIQGGHVAPHPKILSCVTGGADYTESNSRDILVRWTDHPQMLWDVIYTTLASGVKTILHVGPEPNIIPSTFERLSTNVTQQMGSNYIKAISSGVVSGLNRFAWLRNILPAKSALLRAPHIRHVILEDWLLEHTPE